MTSWHDGSGRAVVRAADVPAAILSDVKKLARVLGVAGSIAAVLWAMRDRLVSIAAPREPEPPKFRVVTPPSQPPAPTNESVERGDDLTVVNGIGPVFAERLSEAGVNSLRGMQEAGAQRLADITGVPLSRAETWMSQLGSLIR